MDLEGVVDDFFRAGSALDWERFAAMFAPDARLKQNFGEESDVATAIESLRWLSQAGITVSYENVRRVVGDHAVVEQHDVRLTRPDGVQVVADVCVVVQIDDSGAITRVDEYLDPAAVAPLMA